jgi:hypothetical protein
MKSDERRVVPRFAVQIPLRFRPIGLLHDRKEHAAESINLSRCGAYFASPVGLPLGAALEITLKLPGEITGLETFRAQCLCRVVHAEALGDGRTGYGVEIERFMPPAYAGVWAGTTGAETGQSAHKPQQRT